MANDVNLGRVQAKARGKFDPTVQYKMLDFVHLNGKGYQCINDSLGNDVTNTKYFTEFVRNGTDGKDGATISVNGVSEVDGNVEITADNLDTTPPPDYPDWTNAQEYMRGLKLMIEDETLNADKVATRYVATVAGATGSASASIEGQADYITAHKEVAAKNFFTKGIVYDKKDNLEVLSGKILELDSEFTAVNKSQNAMAVYGEDINKGDLLQLQNSYNFINTNKIDVMPNNPCYKCAYSPDGKFYAVLSTISPFLYVYNVSFDTDGNQILKLIPDISFNNTANSNNGIGFSPDSQSLYVGCVNNPFIIMYKLVNGTFVQSGNLPVTPSWGCYGVACSNNIVALTFAGQFRVYLKRSDLVYEDITKNVDVPISVPSSVKFSDDGKLMFTVNGAAPYLHIYKIHEDIIDKLPTDEFIFTRLATPDATVAFTDIELVGNTLLCTSTASPYLHMYTKKEDDTFEKIALTMDTPPSQPVYCITKGEKNIYIHGNYLYIYPLALDAIIKTIVVGSSSANGSSSTTHNGIEYLNVASQGNPKIITLNMSRLEEGFAVIYQGEFEHASITLVKISNDDKYIALAYNTAPAHIGIYDGRTYEHIVDITGFNGTVKDMDFSFDSAYITVATDNPPFLYVYKINEDKTVSSLTITGKVPSVATCLKFSLQGFPEGHQLFCGVGNTIDVYTIFGDKVTFNYSTGSLPGLSTITSISISPYHKYICCSSTNTITAAILLYNTGNKKYAFYQNFTTSGHGSIFTKRGLLVLIDNVGNLKCHDWANNTFAVVPTAYISTGINNPTNIVISDDDTTILACGNIVNNDTRYFVKTLQLQELTNEITDSLTAHNDSLKGIGFTTNSLAFFSNSNKVIATSLAYPFVAIYNRDTQIAKQFDGDFSNRAETSNINYIGVAKYDGLKRETKEVTVF